MTEGERVAEVLAGSIGHKARWRWKLKQRGLNPSSDGHVRQRRLLRLLFPYLRP